MPKAPEWHGNAHAFVDSLTAWIRAAGGIPYRDASVTLFEHAVQAAELARRDQAPDYEVAAALLHDVGLILVTDRMDQDPYAVRLRNHEEVGARWLSRSTKITCSILTPPSAMSSQFSVSTVSA